MHRIRVQQVGQMGTQKAMDGERITSGRVIGNGQTGTNRTRAAGERPTHNAPAGERPTHNAPAGERPTHNAPAGERSIVMVLSAGRCGTRWLTDGLRRLHPEAVAEHEPIGPLYRPRRYF